MPAPNPADSVPLPEVSGLTGFSGRVTNLEAQTGAQISVAVFGGSLAGSLTDSTAWSTSKVPLALASCHKDPSTTPLIEATLTYSDNAAAQALWDGLGGGEVAAAVVNEVLDEAGDATRIQPVITRAGFSAFGQTQWSTSAQAAFAATLPQLAGSEVVLDAMRRVDPSQSYGLGRLPGAVFNGGWGPDVSGRYLTRQFGLVNGQGIAIAVIPSDGSYASGQQILDRIALEILAPMV